MPSNVAPAARNLQSEMCTGLPGRSALRFPVMGTAYHQFCPVAKAMELLDERWTMLVVRELVSGSTRFNELRRGVPRMSPTLLSKRLKDLEAAGIVARSQVAGDPDVHE